MEENFGFEIQTMSIFIDNRYAPPPPPLFAMILYPGLAVDMEMEFLSSTRRERLNIYKITLTDKGSRKV